MHRKGRGERRGRVGKGGEWENAPIYDGQSMGIGDMHEKQTSHELYELHEFGDLLRIIRAIRGNKTIKCGGTGECTLAELPPYLVVMFAECGNRRVPLVVIGHDDRGRDQRGGLPIDQHLAAAQRRVLG